MKRVVLDTSIYISALVFGGVARQVFDSLDTGGFVVCVSQPIVDEVTEVLRHKFGWTPAELDYALPPLWKRAVMVTPAGRIAVCAGPDDNRILECARAARADVVITGDDHLLRFERFEGAAIVSPRVFLGHRQGV
jgi:putative PIN family toxin of toxin-antitoxin system